MMCAMCDNPKKLKRKRVSKWYKESGLDNIRLEGVIEYRCDKCGEAYYSYGNMDQLHALIARKLIGKKGNLNGAEIRFLRKTLGYNSSMFAKLLGIKLETLSRRENARNKPLASDALDHEIRFLYASKQGPDRDYDLHDRLLSGAGEDLKQITIKHKPSGWKNDEIVVAL